ncbi:MAG: peptidylprolyl isomerase [Anaerolineae bacterium]|nr:peptidylprolyl isomerase [Anaerolineae bacterium]
MNPRLTGALMIAFLLAVLLLAGCGPAASTPPPALNPTNGTTAPAAVAATAAPGQPAARPGVTPAAQAPADPAVAARVNGEAILMADYQREIAQARNFLLSEQRVNPNTPEGQQALQTTYNQVLEALIAEALIRQYAQKAGLTVSPDELTKSIDQLTKEMGGAAEFDKALSARGLTREQFLAEQRDQLLGNKVRDAVTKDVPQTVEQINARHILVQTVDEAVKAAKRVDGGEDFAKVAREVSKDPTTAKSGGDLGWFPRGLMVPEFEQAAFSLAPKQISSPVQTQFGWHVIQVLEKDPARKLSDDKWQELRQVRFQTWLEEQRDAAKIERNVN